MSNVPQNRGGKLVTYTPVEGNYTFNYQGPYGEIIQELNYFCPCNGTTDPKDKKMWQSDVTRTITPSDCARGPSKSSVNAAHRPSMPLPASSKRSKGT